MERIEIIEGLKQAVERGEPLEKAKQSFINAGYSQQDVEDSARKLSQGALTLSNVTENINSAGISTTTQYPELPTLNKTNIPPQNLQPSKQEKEPPTINKQSNSAIQINKQNIPTTQTTAKTNLRAPQTYSSSKDKTSAEKKLIQLSRNASQLNQKNEIVQSEKSNTEKQKTRKSKALIITLFLILLILLSALIFLLTAKEKAIELLKNLFGK